MKQAVFFVSDGTGITAETLGHSLLTQFDDIEFELHSMPYTNTEERVHEAVAEINKFAEKAPVKPIIFATLLTKKLQTILADSNATVMDFFAVFLPRMADVLKMQPTEMIGRTHGLDNDYMTRIDAVNYALANDDGATTKAYDEADLILIGVSRCGKTPTCLYLAMQFGLFAANYPLTEEDLDKEMLPKALQPHSHKLFGLTIEPERLCHVRQERRPNSQYAKLAQCEFEIRTVEKLYRQENIPWMDTSSRSIEEISTKILAMTDLKRRIFK